MKSVLITAGESVSLKEKKQVEDNWKQKIDNLEINFSIEVYKVFNSYGVSSNYCRMGIFRIPKL